MYRLPANILFALTLLSTIVLPTSSYADSFTFSGYMKSYGLAQDSITIENMGVQTQAQSIAGSFQSQNAIRLMASYLSSSKGNIEIDYEIQPLYFSNSAMAEYYTEGNLGVIGGTVSSASNQYRFKD